MGRVQPSTNLENTRRSVSPYLHFLAALICLAFVVMQASTHFYGTTINNVEHIARAKVSPGAIRESVLNRRNLIVEKSGIAETREKWLMRFKLYSVEADEAAIIMALARIKPAEFKFDPGMYQYGGAFLYPLGGWYFALTKLGLIELRPLPEMMATPDRMDAVYASGRFFVLIAFALSAFVLWHILIKIADPTIALLCLGIYLALPITITFTQQIKPHWYALLWANLAILGSVRLIQRQPAALSNIILMGISTGLAVGAAATFGVFSILLWLGLAIAVLRDHAKASVLFIVPAVAIGTFLAFNPYLILNFSGFQAERRALVQNWFQLDPGMLDLPIFIYNSMLPGLGVAFTVLALVLVVWRLVLPQAPNERWLAAGVLVTIIIASLVTGSFKAWHINVRYAPYMISGALLFFAVIKLPRKALVLACVLALSILQSVPFLLAYRDENVPARSTRMKAARWIDANIPKGVGIRLGTVTLSPYEVPPFHFAHYKINPKDAEYYVFVEPELDRPLLLQGTILVKRFRPRLPDWGFAFVYGYINPQISIYRVVGERGQ